MDLSEMQRERNVWVSRNFPGDTLMDSFQGMVEEIGEISHHILKRRQGIRGSDEMHTEEIKDGVCDLIIFALGIATHEGFDLGAALDETWDKVKNRDWVKDPEGVNAS